MCYDIFMDKKSDNLMKISVRHLVEFMLREGDLDSSAGGSTDPDAMQLGSKIHRKIQKKMGSNYEAEVPLFMDHKIPVGKRDFFTLRVEGRADGVVQGKPVMIDEIKSTYADILRMKEPVKVHQAQAMCYAYMVAKKEELPEVEVQMTYVNIESEAERRLKQTFSYAELENWYLNLIEEYSKWAIYEYKWKKKRQASIHKLEFPFPYREGQKTLAAGVYKTIEQGKKLYLEAPTGVGKTISTVFPAVKAMGEGLTSRIFYLTAKTITRTVAEECFQLLADNHLRAKTLTLTAKEKLCVLDKVDCNPRRCDRAKGHYDRINEAVYDLIQSEVTIDREKIESYAAKHMVCPYEMSLDVALFMDIVICDYNYVFDPNVYLRRFFAGDKKEDYVFLIDEAHNLVERGREMYSAALIKEDFLKLKRVIKPMYDKEPNTENKQLLGAMMKILDACNRQMLEWKHGCDEFTEWESISLFQFHILRLIGKMEEFMKEYELAPEKEDVLEFYFEVRRFENIADALDEKYTIYTDYDEENHFRVKLQCMDPSTNLGRVLEKGKSAIFFSATLLPVKYYREQLAGKEDDYAMYAQSSFPPENRRIFIAKEVSTLYKMRSPQMYERIADYLCEFTKAKQGNYIAFFPSYAFMEQVLAYLPETDDMTLRMQNRSMTEGEKEDFLASFTKKKERTQLGCCVLGGIFSEGIDLKNDSLIGAAIVGTGLPMVCNERELFRRFYQKKNGRGFDYAYLYQGMNKVLQAGGRVIRTMEDRGIILLLDDRFLMRQYYELFPREWFPSEPVTMDEMKERLHEFWQLHQ